MSDDSTPDSGGTGPGGGSDLPAGQAADGSAPTAPAPTVMSRKELRAQRGSPHTWYYVLGGVAMLVVAGVVALVVTSGSKPSSASKPPATTSTSAVPPSTTVPTTCPLTGTPAPGGTVPARPALGVKIGNYPDDRPSAGLNQADVVFEEPVEGGITRLVAVFQCQSPALVGDLRSARQPDVGILSQLSKPLFVHAGGIDPVIALLQAANLTDENLQSGPAASADIQQPGRYAPYSTFANTATLWGLDPSDTTPPAPIFTYTAAPPAGSVAGSGGSAHIPFSGTSDVTWTWNPAANNYLRSYSTGPDTLIDGSQSAANNVVIMTVQTSNGPWLENDVGGLEVQIPDTGSGPLVVLRNGVAISGTWTRTSITQPPTLTATNGTPITLQPGNTWEELVPSGVAVTTAPGPATALPTASK
jgi:Protein of unknown function (DUF3048) N-terminal domain/Protein of unknown function (DUF3048) C-terminal domain